MKNKIIFIRTRTSGVIPRSPAHLNLWLSRERVQRGRSLKHDCFRDGFEMEGCQGGPLSADFEPNSIFLSWGNYSGGFFHRSKGLPNQEHWIVEKDIPKLFSQCWQNDKGVAHREGDLPARIDNGNRFWYKDGVLHRGGDKPAYISRDGKRSGWYWRGERHRISGPAKQDLKKNKTGWYLDGNELTKEQWATDPRVVALMGQDDPEDWLKWL